MLYIKQESIFFNITKYIFNNNESEMEDSK